MPRSFTSSGGGGGGGGIGGSTGSTDNAILLADGTGGSTLKASGVKIEPFASGSWVDLPTTGPSAIGTGGAGSNPLLAYVASGGQWYSGSSVGGLAIRNNVEIGLCNDGSFVPALKIASQQCVFTAAAASHNPVTIKGASSQTGDLFQLRNSADTLLSAFDAAGAWKPPSMADSAAPNNSVYYSTTASKLVYKDSGGTVNNLY